VTALKKSLCESCGEPLFLTKEECRNFIEAKMKEGYIVCRCCGTKQKTAPQKKANNIQNEA